MIFRPYYHFETGCAAYLFGCPTMGKCAVVDAHEEEADAYVEFAAKKVMAITHALGLAERSQVLFRVLADRLQHPVAPLAGLRLGQH